MAEKKKRGRPAKKRPVSRKKVEKKVIETPISEEVIESVITEEEKQLNEIIETHDEIEIPIINEEIKEENNIATEVVEENKTKNKKNDGFIGNVFGYSWNGQEIDF